MAAANVDQHILYPASELINFPCSCVKAPPIAYVLQSRAFLYFSGRSRANPSRLAFCKKCTPLAHKISSNEIQNVQITRTEARELKEFHEAREKQLSATREKTRLTRENKKKAMLLGEAEAEKEKVALEKAVETTGTDFAVKKRNGDTMFSSMTLCTVFSFLGDDALRCGSVSKEWRNAFLYHWNSNFTYNVFYNVISRAPIIFKETLPMNLFLEREALFYKIVECVKKETESLSNYPGVPAILAPIHSQYLNTRRFPEDPKPVFMRNAIHVNSPVLCEFLVKETKSQLANTLNSVAKSLIFFHLEDAVTQAFSHWVKYATPKMTMNCFYRSMRPCDGKVYDNNGDDDDDDS